MEDNQLTLKRFLNFVIPSILLLVFVSFYTSVDSLFIARYVGEDGLAGQNLVMPLYGVAFSCGIMFATGGGAIIAIKLGKGMFAQANRDFSSLLTVGIFFGILATIVCYFFREELVVLLGANDELKGYALGYGTFLILAFPFLIINVIFDNILRIDNRPRMSLFVSVIGGVINIILDYLFVYLWKWGIEGAGLATFIGIVSGGIISFCSFFLYKTKFTIRLCWPDFSMIKATVVNGSSEMITEIATAVTILIMNMLALKYIGSNGVAALTIVLTFNFFASSLFIGFSMGAAPLLSYYYGRKDYDTIGRIVGYSRVYILLISVLLLLFLYFFADTFVSFFVAPSSPVFAEAEHGLTFLSVALLICGVNIFGSAFFTSFENGKISAIISFCRTFVFFIISAVLLPLIFNSEGIWMVLPAAELSSLGLTLMFLVRYQKKYNYKVF